MAFPIDPFTLSTLVSGGTSLLGSGLSFFGQKSANSANSRENSISRWYDAYKTVMQNKFQKDMYDYTFEKETAYNDPSAQMQRYEDAGLNPYLMMQGQNAVGASSTSMSSSNGGSPSVTPMQNPYDGVGRMMADLGPNLMQGLIQFLSLSNQERVATSQIALNDANAKAITAGIPGIKSDNTRKEGEARQSTVAADTAESMQSYAMATIREQYAAQKLQNDIIRLEMPYMPEKIQMGMTKLVLELQQLDEDIKIKRLTQGEIKERTNQIKELCRGLNLDNNLKNYAPSQIETLLNYQVLQTTSDAMNSWHTAVKGNPKGGISSSIIDIAHFLSPESAQHRKNGTPQTPFFDFDSSYHFAPWHPYNQH